MLNSIISDLFYISLTLFFVLFVYTFILSTNVLKLKINNEEVTKKYDKLNNRLIKLRKVAFIIFLSIFILAYLLVNT